MGTVYKAVEAAAKARQILAPVLRGVQDAATSSMLVDKKREFLFIAEQIAYAVDQLFAITRGETSPGQHALVVQDVLSALAIARAALHVPRLAPPSCADWLVQMDESCAVVRTMTSLETAAGQGAEEPSEGKLDRPHLELVSSEAQDEQAPEVPTWTYPIQEHEPLDDAPARVIDADPPSNELPLSIPLSRRSHRTTQRDPSSKA